jgi:hypothetical protein
MPPSWQRATQGLPTTLDLMHPLEVFLQWLMVYMVSYLKP